MKILCLTPWFPSHKEDQHGNFILDSIESLVALGHEVVVLVTRPWRPGFSGLIHPDWIKKKIQIEQFSDKFPLKICYYLSIPRNYFCSFSHTSYRKRITPILIKLVKEYQCDLIHAHTEISGMVAVDVGQELKIPTVVTLHGISTEKKLYKGESLKLLFEYTLEKANRVVLVGQSLIPFSKKFVKNDEHFRIIHNGFRLNKNNLLTNQKKWLLNFFRLVSVSNLQEGKGIEINLHALATLKKMGIVNWHYTIVGDGNLRKKLELLTHHLNLKKEVSFVGACHHDKVYEYLLNSDIFILPSYREAFGVAYVEAMSCGLLTIGIEKQGPAEFIEHAKTGFLIPPKNSEKLVDAIKFLFVNPEKMQTIANAGKNYVHQFLTWESHALKLTHIYKELVEC